MNPYSSPVAEGPPRARAAADQDDVVTPRILAAMKQTRPWVTLMAVLGFIGTGFMVLGGIAVVLVAPAGLPGGRALGLIYLIGAAMYGVGSTLLYRYRSSIASIERGYGLEALENALEHQKSFWRFIGITTAVVLGIYVLGIVAAVVVGGMAAM